MNRIIPCVFFSISLFFFLSAFYFKIHPCCLVFQECIFPMVLALSLSLDCSKISSIMWTMALLIFSIVCILWYWVPLSFLLFPFFFFFLFIYYFFDYIRKDIQSWTVVKIVEIDFTQELTIIIGEKCLSAELVHSWPQTVWADGDVLSRSKERPVIEQY